MSWEATGESSPGFQLTKVSVLSGWDRLAILFLISLTFISLTVKKNDKTPAAAEQLLTH